MDGMILKPDYEKSLERVKAFWEGAVLDRPLVEIKLPVRKTPAPARREYSTYDEMWRDVDYRSECIAWDLENTLFLGDALPIAWPNLGPEIFSAWCGCKYIFAETTTWSEPCVMDWDCDAPEIRLNKEHELFKLLERFTLNLLNLGRGKFITGLTDFHSGADHVAALRDPQNLAMDLIDHPQAVKDMLVKSSKDYFDAYDHFRQLIRRTNSIDYTVSWMGCLGSEGRFYIPSNDFSCMISPDMFIEFFLESIREECQFYDRSIYHLDGPTALKHLDALLSIPELGAIQWMPGTGNEGFSRWAGVYQRIQKAHKGFVLYVHKDELSSVFDSLRPEGVCFSHVGGINTVEEAESVIRRIEKWK